MSVQVTLKCDRCGATATCDSALYWPAAIAEGWGSGDDDEHLCPECRVKHSGQAERNTTAPDGTDGERETPADSATEQGGTR